jgi:hypothetical protein
VDMVVGAVVEELLVVVEVEGLAELSYNRMLWMHDRSKGATYPPS